MVFSSAIFLFAFLPITMILYYIMPGIMWKNALLIVAGIIFYAFGEPVYVLLMIASTIVNYILGIIVSSDKQVVRRLGIISAVIINIAVLAVFKYSGFIITNINSVAGTQIRIPDIALPIGISFYTFQALSYVIDVYRKPEMCSKNYFNVLLYISFFPQLIAGPIVKYGDISKEIQARKLEISEISDGIRRFIYGLGKKMIISNSMASVADMCFALDSCNYNFLVAWMAAITYALQIYYDFSGYSDMAIGLAKMFGFHLKENFNYPYSACSIKDFWTRWHISLSSWFKDYLYIPLGGNRVSKFRVGINKLIVFFITGLWHGANWTFIVWGMLHGVFSMLETYGVIPIKKMASKWYGHIYTMLVVITAFVIFRAESLKQGFMIVKEMFTGFSLSGDRLMGIKYFVGELTPYFILILVIAIVFSSPVVDKIRNCRVFKGNMGFKYCSYIISTLVLMMCILEISSSSYNPFIYFQF